MEEIPTLPEINRHVPEGDPKKAADWFINHETILEPASPLKYELNISEGVNATIELDNKPETELDRRREVLDESFAKEPVASRMVPVGKILASYADRQTYPAATGQKLPKARKLKITGLLSGRPLYRQALKNGLLAGLTVAVISIIVLLKAS